MVGLDILYLVRQEFACTGVKLMCVAPDLDNEA